MITFKSLYYKLTILVAGALVFCIFSYSFGYNIITNSYSMTVLSNKLSPQGWGFFADNPRKDIYHHIYKLNGATFEDVMPVNAHYENLGGLRKTSRMVNFESSLIIKQVDSSKWQKYNGAILPSRAEFVEINNEELHFLKEGKFAIVKTNIPPYLWRNLNNQNNSEIVYVNCSKK